MKLISMTDYVIDQIHKRESIGKCWLSVTKYAQFLKQPIKLEMFLPCDCDGNILKDSTPKDGERIFREMAEQYKNAKQKVLFKNVNKRPLNEHGSFALDVNDYQVGYYKSKPNYWVGMDKTIEDLCGLGFELKQPF